MEESVECVGGRDHLVRDTKMPSLGERGVFTLSSPPKKGKVSMGEICNFPNN